MSERLAPAARGRRPRLRDLRAGLSRGPRAGHGGGAAPRPRGLRVRLVPPRPHDARSSSAPRSRSRWISSSTTAPDPRPEHLLYDRDRRAGPGDVPRELGRWLPLTLGGHTWTLHVATLPAFHSRPERLIPPAVLGSGLLISVLAFVITLLQTHALAARAPARERDPGRRPAAAPGQRALRAGRLRGAVRDLRLEPSARHGGVDPGAHRAVRVPARRGGRDPRVVDRSPPSGRPGPGAAAGRGGRGGGPRLRDRVPLPHP